MTDVGTVYALCTPDDGMIRYVGCTRGPRRRLRHHINECHRGRTPKDAWLRTLLRAGQRPALRVLEVVPAEELFIAERRWVTTLSGHGLLNATRGGRGMSGYSPSPETRAKLRDAFVGRTLPPETRAKMSAAHTGVPRGPFSTEHRARLSEAQRQRFEDPAERQRVGASSRGRRHTPETRERMRAAQRARRAAERDRR